MINNHPNLPGPDRQPVSQKLILPGIPEEPQQPGAYTQRVFVHPDQMRPQMTATSTNPLSKLGALWRADPAYKVLIIATSMVLIAGIIFATFLFNTFAQSAAPASKATTPVAVVPTAPKTSPANLPPTFPTPSGGQGSNRNSSQPPKSATVVLPTLTPSDANQQPTQPTQNANLQLQISDAPPQVRNNSDVPITVMTNQPGIFVHLQATFDNTFNTNTTDAQQTDDNGNVTLNWHVAGFSFKRNFVARITAYATGQNGQQASSQTITVDVMRGF